MQHSCVRDVCFLCLGRGTEGLQSSVCHYSMCDTSAFCRDIGLYFTRPSVRPEHVFKSVESVLPDSIRFSRRYVGNPQVAPQNQYDMQTESILHAYVYRIHNKCATHIQLLSVTIFGFRAPCAGALFPNNEHCCLDDPI